MSVTIADKTVLITGANRGLGHIGATILQTAPDNRSQQRSAILPAQKPRATKRQVP